MYRRCQAFVFFFSLSTYLLVHGMHLGSITVHTSASLVPLVSFALGFAGSSAEGRSAAGCQCPNHRTHPRFNWIWEFHFDRDAGSSPNLYRFFLILG